jgi:hypothetical protein
MNPKSKVLFLIAMAVPLVIFIPVTSACSRSIPEAKVESRIAFTVYDMERHERYLMTMHPGGSEWVELGRTGTVYRQQWSADRSHLAYIEGGDTPTQTIWRRSTVTARTGAVSVKETISRAYVFLLTVVLFYSLAIILRYCLNRPPTATVPVGTGFIR